MRNQSDTKIFTEQPRASFWTRPMANYVLWTLQGILALLFLFAGGMKLVLPTEVMTKQLPLPGLFLRFIGAAEVLGALGLVLPWILGIQRQLTSLAAVGLVLVMCGATVLTLIGGNVAAAVMPFAVGMLLLLVAYGRRSRVKPSSETGSPVHFVTLDSV